MATDEISIADLKQLNESHEMTWFGDGETNWFKSSYPDSAKIYKEHAYFVTGERENNKPRRYTVRRANLETGSIDTVGDFQAYGSQYYAKIAIDNIINGSD